MHIGGGPPAEARGGLWPCDVPLLLCVRWGLLLLPIAHLLPCALVRESPGFQGQLLNVERPLWEWGHLASTAPAESSLVVISGEPQSRSAEPASRLTTVNCCCRQPVPCPGLSLAASPQVRK